mmetsp:Transcript_59865/g.177445  ORF Transcript_59865/g.177445 Transcript_59865/m.177445 type:complete len:83 (+) Transcript_59865:125-373(+)
MAIGDQIRFFALEEESFRLDGQDVRTKSLNRVPSVEEIAAMAYQARRRTASTSVIALRQCAIAFSRFGAASVWLLARRAFSP